MNDLLTAIMTRLTASTLYGAVGGRIFLDVAPKGSQFPYITIQIVTASPDRTFTELFEDLIIQFSIYSISAGATEITGIYTDLRMAIDEVDFTITGYVLLWMRWADLTTMIDVVTTPAGTETLRHWAVDFDVSIQEAAWAYIVCEDGGTFWVCEDETTMIITEG